MAILSFIKKFGGKKKFQLKQTDRIVTDWGRAVVLFFALIFIGSIVGVYIFMNANNIEASGDHEIEGVSVKIINQELLNDTIDYYTLKEERYEKLRENFKGAPSI